ncbi:hypothetical protein DPMN_076540 [Dreissena polymorpha]|uniref:Uncharacterized protein n=1 Tax=Dreissena polymorpha TaxID=45954 RepID=A0A9D4BNR4_DREPO|nr:hypothetical protein DPMN_076540 [Dreissena polymorpha]
MLVIVKIPNYAAVMTEKTNDIQNMTGQHSRNSLDNNDERNSLSRDTSYSLDQDSRRVSTDKDQSSNKKKQVTAHQAEAP